MNRSIIGTTILLGSGWLPALTPYGLSICDQVSMNWRRHINCQLDRLVVFDRNEFYHADWAALLQLGGGGESTIEAGFKTTMTAEAL